MKKLAFSLIALFAMNIQAQDLIIHYDFITDKFTYEQKGKKVDKPTIRKNYEVKVMVENLNPFVFVARCSWAEETVEDNSSISGIASMFTGFPVGGDMLSGLLSGMNTDLIDLGASRSDITMFSTYGQAKVDLHTAFDNFNRLFEIEQSVLKSNVTTKKLKKLKFNPYMPGDTLKKVAEILVANALKTKNQSTFKITATTFLNTANAMSTDLVEQYNSLLTASDNFLSAYEAFSSEHSDFGEKGMDRTVRSMITNARSMVESYTAEDINQSIEDLENQYNAIAYTPFIYTCNYMANSDRLSLTLDFYETSPYTRTSDYYMGGGDNVDTLRKIRSKNMHVLVQGDMKITTSVGLGFPTYFDKNVEFSNRDSIITSSVGNNFGPCISTFLNFYPYSGRNINWGGTFGVGIPVQSEGASALNFFLGGSAVLGNASKVALHGGLAIGQLGVLSNGLKVGDNIGNEETIPETKKAFTTGAFFGISFSLGK